MMATATRQPFPLALPFDFQPQPQSDPFYPSDPPLFPTPSINNTPTCISPSYLEQFPNTEILDAAPISPQTPNEIPGWDLFDPSFASPLSNTASPFTSPEENLLGWGKETDPLPEIERLPESIETGEETGPEFGGQMEEMEMETGELEERKIRPAWGIGAGNRNEDGQIPMMDTPRSNARISRYPKRYSTCLPTTRTSTSPSQRRDSFHKLRSTNLSSRRKNSSAGPAFKPIIKSEQESPANAHLDPRQMHNLIEQRYRSRLNGGFSALLEVLPARLLGEENLPGAKENGIFLEGGIDDRKVSKSEVLVIAKGYIAELEKEKGRLEREKKELSRRIKEFSACFGAGSWEGLEMGRV